MRWFPLDGFHLAYYAAQSFSSWLGTPFSSERPTHMSASRSRLLAPLGILGALALVVCSANPAAGGADGKTPALRSGQALLTVAHEHVPVHFLTKKFKSWSVAESANFRFYHNQPHKLVQQVADVAEHTRLVMAQKWFGEVPERWDPKCVVYMHANRAGYTLETKDGGKSEGCTLVRLDGLEVGSRRIHLHCDADDLLSEIVPHEVTHAVMGGNFGSHQTPRWADEGMAILSQPAPSIRHYLNRLRVYRKQHDLFSVDVLMQTDDTKQQNTLEFYCQSVSLVSFLVSHGGPQNFTRFIWDSFRTNDETALKKHYGIASFDELQRRWEEYAFGQGKLPHGYTRQSMSPARITEQSARGH